MAYTTLPAAFVILIIAMKPTPLHDPLLDVLPRTSPAAAVDLRLALLACLALLLAALSTRLLRTAPTHPDYAARADMLRLLLVVWGGLAVEWVRSRCDLATPGFWAASAALLPFALGAVVLSLRLFRAYRSSEPASSASSSARKGGRA